MPFDGINAGITPIFFVKACNVGWLENFVISIITCKNFKNVNNTREKIIQVSAILASLKFVLSFSANIILSLDLIWSNKRV